MDVSLKNLSPIIRLEFINAVVSIFGHRESSDKLLNLTIIWQLILGVTTCPFGNLHELIFRNNNLILSSELFEINQQK